MNEHHACSVQSPGKKISPLAEPPRCSGKVQPEQIQSAFTELIRNGVRILAWDEVRYLLVQHSLMAHQFRRDGQCGAAGSRIFPKSVSGTSSLPIKPVDRLAQGEMCHAITRADHGGVTWPQRCTNPEQQRQMRNDGGIDQISGPPEQGLERCGREDICCEPGDCRTLCRHISHVFGP